MLLVGLTPEDWVAGSERTHHTKLEQHSRCQLTRNTRAWCICFCIYLIHKIEAVCFIRSYVVCCALKQFGVGAACALRQHLLPLLRANLANLFKKALEKIGDSGALRSWQEMTPPHGDWYVRTKPTSRNVTEGYQTKCVGMVHT